ncbi:S-layer homology domain-containing protein [Gorillibacterium sp. CAU 1737]|uniref:S-layer homology domain-containing protein n=1 Tax=Gorillibacterium sp. CAU 1737 TaxID=3140362 RepID=UPI00326179C3
MALSAVMVLSSAPAPAKAAGNNSTWQQVAGDVLSSAAQATSLYVVNGVPYVSAASASKVQAWKGNGSGWTSLLDQSTTAPTNTSLFLNEAGKPYVAYSNSATAGYTKVMKFTSGTSWTSLDAPVPANDTPPLKASSISLTIDEDGTPYLAANQTSMSGRVSVTKYKNSAWEYVGSKSIAGEQAFSASMDLYQSTPYVAYCVNDSFAYGAYVTMKKYDGTQWNTVGNAQISTKSSSYLSGAYVAMKISSNGTPYVAFADPGTGNRLMVKKLSGSNWITVGSDYLTAGEASSISLYVDGETPYVAYKDGTAASTAGVTVKGFNSQSNGWITLGNSEIAQSSNAKGISLFVESGIPYVSYSTNSAVKVMKYAEPPKQLVTITPGNASVVYAGTTIDLSSVSGLFTVTNGAGARTYSLEAASSEGSGEGQLNNGTSLSVTKAGIFRIGLVTAESSTHTAGSKAIATLTVGKGTQIAPSGLSAGYASSSTASDGKITGLTNGREYEYKLTGGPAYTKVTASASGEIPDLPVGTYVVRLPETSLYNASADSTEIMVVDAASLTYSATVNTASYTYPAATANYAQQAEQQFTLTNTGTGTLTGLSVSLSNADFTITSMVFVTQLAPNGQATIRVRPQTGLAAGTHTGTLTFTGADGISLTVDLSFTVNKIQTYNSLIPGASSSYNSIYNGTAWELVHWFKFGASDGKRVYTLEEGTTGQGFFRGSQLTFTSVGTFVVGLVTEETDIYAQTPKILFTINVSKGTIPTPTIGAVNASAGSSDGKITGLIANKECEYKLVGESSYTTVTTNANGQITGLPAGTYVVRYPDNDLHTASSDSNSATIGEDALAYSAAVNPSSHTFAAAGYGYGPQQEQPFTITNTGTSTITNLSASLINGERFTISTPLSAAELAPHATATVSVQPNSGLSVGTHTGTLAITGADGISLMVDLSFAVRKGDQNRPEGLGTENATPGTSDGKIIHLIPGTKYEYRLSSESEYREGVADANGQITGLPAGAYLVRFAATDLYNASPDSNSVTIGEGALTYSASVNPSSHSFTAATYGYGPQQTQEFTITNTGNSPLTGLSASLINGERFTISTPLSAAELAPHATAIVSVQPNSGLSVGTHTGTLALTGADGISLTVDLSFTVYKRDQNRPEGLGAEHATIGHSDGKIIHLVPGTKVEYRLNSESAYREGMADANGQITGLPAGAYVVRFAATDLYNASPDSNVIEIRNRQSSESSVIAVTAPANAVINQDEAAITATVTNSVVDLTVQVTVSAGASWMLYSDSACTHEISKTLQLSVGLNTAYLKVIAQDGTSTVYKVNITRKSPSSDGDSNSTGGSTSAGSSDGASVIVNGETKIAGTAQTTTDPDGRTTTTVTVDSGRLESILASEKSGAVVVIPVAGNADTAAGVLTGQMVKIMENQAATLVVRTDSSTYTLPASEINITAVSQQLGTNVDLKDITVVVRIADPSNQMASAVEKAAKNGGFSLMLPSVDYTVTGSYGGRTVSISSFNAYVERRIAIPEGIDPAKITTGVVVEPNGTVYHVPTQVTVMDSKYYAVINSLTNSTYSVIWNPIEFTDMNNHWAKASVNNMGSRKVVTGVGNGEYDPDRNMTRAEFAAVMVRGLGLAPDKGSSSFRDVASTEWYCGYIKTAAAYGIIKGYSDTKFGPNDTITREQAMTMIARAMKITGLTSGLANGEGSKLLEAYNDSANVSAFAYESITECIKTGVVSGRGSHTLAPKAYVTRAEVAAMVERLLQKSKLI